MVQAPVGVAQFADFADAAFCDEAAALVGADGRRVGIEDEQGDAVQVQFAKAAVEQEIDHLAAEPLAPIGAVAEEDAGDLGIFIDEIDVGQLDMADVCAGGGVDDFEHPHVGRRDSTLITGFQLVGGERESEMCAAPQHQFFRGVDPAEHAVDVGRVEWLQGDWDHSENSFCLTDRPEPRCLLTPAVSAGTGERPPQGRCCSR